MVDSTYNYMVYVLDCTVEYGAETHSRYSDAQFLFFSKWKTKQCTTAVLNLTYVLL